MDRYSEMMVCHGIAHICNGIELMIATSVWNGPHIFNSYVKAMNTFSASTTSVLKWQRLILKWSLLIIDYWFRVSLLLARSIYVLSIPRTKVAVQKRASWHLWTFHEQNKTCSWLCWQWHTLADNIYYNNIYQKVTRLSMYKKLEKMCIGL